MLSFDLRSLQDGPVVTEATVPPEHPALEGLTMELVGPVVVSGRLAATAGDDVLWHGHLRASVAGECRRCLQPVEQVLDEAVEVVFSADPDLLDDPSVYPLDVPGQHGGFGASSAGRTGPAGRDLSALSARLCRALSHLWGRFERRSVRMHGARLDQLRHRWLFPSGNSRSRASVCAVATTRAPAWPPSRAPAAAPPSSRTGSARRAGTTRARSALRSRTSRL